MGYGVILILVAAGREVFGSGTLMGMNIVPQMLVDAGYVNAGLMVLAPGAFFLLGIIVWAQQTLYLRGQKNK